MTYHITSTPAWENERPLAANVAATSKSSKVAIAISIIASVPSLVVALGVGLGIGLKKKALLSLLSLD